MVWVPNSRCLKIKDHFLKPYNTTDFATDLSLDSTNATGSNSTFIITDAAGKILGTPPTLEGAKGIDFNEAGTGVCLI